MIVFILRRDDRAIAISVSKKDALRAAAEESAEVEHAILNSVPPAGQTHRAGESNSLIEVLLKSGRRLYLDAPGIGSALAAIGLQRLAKPEELLLVREYFVEYEDEEEQKPVRRLTFDEERGISPLTQRLLPLVDDGGFRLFAHSINTVNYMSSEEELKQFEISGHTYRDVEHPPYQGLAGWTVADIVKDTSYVWEYLFIESTDMGLDQMNLHSSCKATSNPLEAFLYVCLLEFWGCYDSRYPHTLYQGLLRGSFRPQYPLIAEFNKVF